MKTINLAILWHMHQPPYEEPGSSMTLLPWAFLHGMKDYYDMGAVAARHPRMRMNVNFTPCLLEQLAGYADGSLADRTLALMEKHPGEMTVADREYLFRTFFGLTGRMIEQFPRYVELRDLHRAAAAGGIAVPLLTDAEITDLTVLYLLAWCGPTLSRAPSVQAIARKGRGFDAGDRQVLIREARSLIGSTGRLWRDLVDAGIVELSTTPANHPILPLLCSTGAAVAARPDVKLPITAFEAPDEARRQVRTGLDGFERFFGYRPAGMWPAEGSVSDQAVSILKEAGMRWIATDEAILAKSDAADRSDIRHPWTVNGVSIFFRDHFLSDQIGFDYSRRPASKAVADFISQMAARAANSRGGDDLVVVALDGENAWEYYPDGGYGFLDELYGAIEAADFIRPVTMAGYLEKYGPGRQIDRLVPGSWIDGNFDTWIGDPVKNAAWDCLAAAWQAVANADLDGPSLFMARKYLMRAEASDWFWWFGRGHSSIHEREFDFLFRRNLEAVYNAASIPAPQYLQNPIGQEGAGAQCSMPTSFISPRITGRQDSFYKWVGAGSCEHSHGSIHRLEPVISGVRFGFDSAYLYLAVHRFGKGRFFDACRELRVVFRNGHERIVTFRQEASGRSGVTAFDENGATMDESRARAAAIDVFEAAISLTTVCAPDAAGRFLVSFKLEMGTGDIDVERFPWDSWIDLKWNPREFKMNGWFV